MKFNSLTVASIAVIIFSIAAVSAVLDKNWSNLFVIGQAIVFSLIPFFLERYYDIKISRGLKMGIVAFIFATLFLGEINNFYDQFWWWDKLLHFTAGFGLTLIGFALLVQIYAASDLQSTPFLTTLFALCFTAFVAVLWEVFEFGVDPLTTTIMQPDNADTMWDLIVALIAGSIVGVFGYQYLKKRQRNFAGDVIEATGK